MSIFVLVKMVVCVDENCGKWFDGRKPCCPHCNCPKGPGVSLLEDEEEDLGEEEQAVHITGAPVMATSPGATPAPTHTLQVHTHCRRCL